MAIQLKYFYEKRQNGEMYANVRTFGCFSLLYDEFRCISAAFKVCVFTNDFKFLIGVNEY